jgi:hypothetical protein
MGERIAEAVTAIELREKAMRYRAMVKIVADQRIIDALVGLAKEYEALAEFLEKSQAGS